MGVRLRRAGPADVPAVLRLREEVFVREQAVPPALERDGRDAGAVHLVAEDAGEVVGCCRLLREGGTVRLGRMAVAAGARGRGIGARLLELAHEVAREDGAEAVELHAQLAVQGFYARAGYVAEGEPFVEAGIAHVAMRRTLSPLRR